MSSFGGFEVVRDPLWNNIGIDAQALMVLDTAPFQRLRYIRQLGHAFLVYPGATHTRFEHALGTYHLARRALAMLQERDALASLPADDPLLIRLAALLHDVGHYPFSHALEEAGLPSHEVLARDRLAENDLGRALAATGLADAAERIAALIAGAGTSPLRGLISGALDLDKIEYLTRDARMCGVPYGTVDVDRLLHSLVLVEYGGAPVIGLHEKGVSALESLLFAKYQMYRNVYWHHAVRSATCMFKRVVRDALACGDLDVDAVARSTDETLMEALGRGRAPLAERLRQRRLFKRVLDLSATELPAGAGVWVADDPGLTAEVEDRLAAECGRRPGEVLLDFPRKPAMLSSDVPVLTRRGSVAPARVGIERVAEDLHTAARRLRVYAVEPIPLRADAVVGLVEGAESEVRARLRETTPLLGRT
jgi:HD superfamily phosphohydrolase